jgi:DNA-binding GntR family transcriptional regulator
MTPRGRRLKSIRQEHLELLEEAQTRYSDFSELDERFHRLINDASRNRFKCRLLRCHFDDFSLPLSMKQERRKGA